MQDRIQDESEWCMVNELDGMKDTWEAARAGVVGVQQLPGVVEREKGLQKLETSRKRWKCSA